MYRRRCAKHQAWPGISSTCDISEFASASKLNDLCPAKFQKKHQNTVVWASKVRHRLRVWPSHSSRLAGPAHQASRPCPSGCRGREPYVHGTRCARERVDGWGGTGHATSSAVVTAAISHTVGAHVKVHRLAVRVADHHRLVIAGRLDSTHGTRHKRSRTWRTAGYHRPRRESGQAWGTEGRTQHARHPPRCASSTEGPTPRLAHHTTFSRQGPAGDRARFFLSLARSVPQLVSVLVCILVCVPLVPIAGAHAQRRGCLWI